MKKNYVLLSALVSISALLSFEWNSTETLQAYYNNSHKVNGSGAPAGRTGAPGEQNCTACHAGTVQSDAGVNSVIISDGNGPVTEYVPGQQYTVAIAMNSASPKNGFQIVSLNSSNAMAGTVTIIGSSGTQLLNGSGGKKYVTHNTSGNSQTAWAYTWTAPATNVGDVTFYLATNETNNNNNSSGDIIRLTQKTIGSTVGIKENSTVAEVNLGYAAATNSLNVVIDSKQNGTAAINILDIAGKSVQFEELGSVANGSNGYSVKLNNELPSGVYIAHISVNNNFVTKKFFIE